MVARSKGEGEEGKGEEGGGEGDEAKGAETVGGEEQGGPQPTHSVAVAAPKAEVVAEPPNDPPGSPGSENDGSTLVGMSLDRFGPENEFRLTCHAISSHRWFDKVIIALIVASSVGQHVHSAALGVPALATSAAWTRGLRTGLLYAPQRSARPPRAQWQLTVRPSACANAAHSI